MTTISWNVGSLAKHALALVDNVSDSVSGTMIDMATKAVITAENITGQSLDVTNITDSFIPGLQCLTMGELLQAMSIQGTDANSIRLGELQITKGGGKDNPIQTSSDWWIKRGEAKLREEIGIKIRSTKTNG